MLGGSTYTLKVCRTCKIIRPLRSFHCDLCDCCILEHGGLLCVCIYIYIYIYIDHHCPWVGNCIGLRNRRFFARTVFYLTALILLTMFSLIYRLIEIRYTDEDGTGSWIVALCIFLIIFMFIFCCSTGGATCSQCSTICEGTTTNEVVRHRWKETKNPFDDGCFGNCYHFCCTRIQGSIIGRKRVATGEEGEDNVDIEVIGGN